MAKEVAFYSRFKSYQTVIVPTTSQMIDGNVRTVPAIMARFSGGFLKTDDQKTIDVLSKDPNCAKVGDAEIKKIKQGKLQFKGNMSLMETSITSEERLAEEQARADSVARENKALREEIAKLKGEKPVKEEKPKKDSKKKKDKEL